MGKSPAFPLYAQDLLVGAALMTNEEFGMYTRLLCYQWVHDAVPGDEKGLKTLLGAKKSIPGVVLQKFKLCDDGKYRNDRMEIEREKQSAFRLKQALNGIKGGRPNKTQIKPKNNPSLSFGITQTITQKKPFSLQSSSSYSFNNPPTPKQPSASPPGFEDFWNAYPRKKAKGSAEKAWKKVPNPMETLGMILRAIESQKNGEQWRKDRGQFIPYPASWLNAQGWLDEEIFRQKFNPPAPIS